MEGVKILADDGFAGEGNVIGGGDEVEIDAAYDYDWFAHIFWAPCGLRLADSRAAEIFLPQRRRVRGERLLQIRLLAAIAA
jgi:hypothetical protein